MTWPQTLTFIILAATMALFVWGRLRYDLVGAAVALGRGGGGRGAVRQGVLWFFRRHRGDRRQRSPGERRGATFGRDRNRAATACAALDADGVTSGGSRRLGRRAFGLREKYRRACHDDAGRLPARPQEWHPGRLPVDADGLRSAAWRPHHAYRNVAECHRRAHARGARRDAVLDVRLCPGRTVPRAGRHDLSGAGLASAAGRSQRRRVDGRGIQSGGLHDRGEHPGRFAPDRQDGGWAGEPRGKRDRGADALALARPYSPAGRQCEAAARSQAHPAGAACGTAAAHQICHVSSWCATMPPRQSMLPTTISGSWRQSSHRTRRWPNARRRDLAYTSATT